MFYAKRLANSRTNRRVAIVYATFVDISLRSNKYYIVRYVYAEKSMQIWQISDLSLRKSEIWLDIMYRISPNGCIDFEGLRYC